jgi:glycosyltransferase involved in cell wall biosynthesis
VRILLVSHGFPPYGVAGAERMSHQRASALIARGHDVTVLTRRASVAPPTFALEREQIDGIDVVRIAGGDATFGLYPGHEDDLERVFVRMLAELDPDVVLITHLLHHSAGYVGIAHAWGIPVVLELRDFYVACPLAHLRRPSGELCAGPEGGAACARYCFPDQERSEERWSARASGFGDALREADAVVALSRFVAEYFAEGRAGASPIEVIGNGVGIPGTDRREPRAPGEVLEVASIGVVVEHKGPHVVVDALRRAGVGPVRYRLLGAFVPDYAQRLREAAADVPGLEIDLAGPFEPAQLPALLERTDLVVVPTIVWEAFSNAAYEALALGIPVLASRAGGLVEAIRDGENGELFAAGDADELAAILTRLAADRARITELAEGIRPSDWPTVHDRIDALEALLERVVGRPQRIT